MYLEDKKGNRRLMIEDRILREKRLVRSALPTGVPTKNSVSRRIGLLQPDYQSGSYTFARRSDYLS